MNSAVKTILFCLVFAFASGTQHCSTREFQGYGGEVIDGGLNCPYQVDVGSWLPGQPMTMELANVEEIPFQLFLVSVQLGNALIGEMTVSANDNDTIVTCGTTSVQHSDLTNKTAVTFTWTAPNDIADNVTEVIVRASVGTDETFWKDCDVFLLSRNEEPITTTPTTTPTTTTPMTSTTATVQPRQNSTTQRLASPDWVDEETTAKVGTLPASYSCKQAGNVYTVMDNSDCKRFKQKVGENGHEYTFTCPARTRFDVDNCVCAFMPQSKCKI